MVTSVKLTTYSTVTILLLYFFVALRNDLYLGAFYGCILISLLILGITLNDKLFLIIFYCLCYYLGNVKLSSSGLSIHDFTFWFSCYLLAFIICIEKFYTIIMLLLYLSINAIWNDTPFDVFFKYFGSFCSSFCFGYLIFKYIKIRQYKI